jgi:hypothetical protein
VIRGFLLCGLLAVAPTATAQDGALLPWLVQWACLDAAGRAVPGLLPIEPACRRQAP